MEVRDYQPGDENKIIELFELVYDRSYSMDQWNWRFRDNPAGSHMIKLMWDGDTLAGHYAVSPIIITVEGRQVKTCHSLATMTHPSYGRRGIFKTLASELYDDLENKYGYEAIWGYPNTNSHYGFLKNLRWEDIGIIHTLGKSWESQSVSDFLLKEETQFTDYHTSIFANKLKAFPVSVARNKEYLNWRYFSKPSVDYKLFTSTDPDRQALFVTKIYPSKSEDKFVLNLVECVLEDFTLLEKYLNQIIESYTVPIDGVTTWVNLWDKDHLQFEKNGFIPVSPQTYFSARSMPGVRSQILHFPNWYISMGDSDVF